MFGLQAGVVVESLVTVLLAVTLGYCVVLNTRLKRLHSDRDQLRKMVTDLVQATTLANGAIQELKATALAAENGLQNRISESERLGIELAQHITSGRQMIEKIGRIVTIARQNTPVVEEKPAAPEPNKIRSALEQLSTRPRIRGDAA